MTRGEGLVMPTLSAATAQLSIYSVDLANFLVLIKIRKNSSRPNMAVVAALIVSRKWLIDNVGGT